MPKHEILAPKYSTQSPHEEHNHNFEKWEYRKINGNTSNYDYNT